MRIISALPKYEEKWESEGRGRRAEDRRQRAEGRWRRAEDRWQRAEGGGRRAEGRGRRVETKCLVQAARMPPVPGSRGPLPLEYLAQGTRDTCYPTFWSLLTENSLSFFH